MTDDIVRRLRRDSYVADDGTLWSNWPRVDIQTIREAAEAILALRVRVALAEADAARLRATIKRVLDNCEEFGIVFNAAEIALRGA